MKQTRSDVIMSLHALTTDVDMDTVPAHITVEDIKYFEDKVKRNPWDNKAQTQLELIKQLGVTE